MVFQYFRLYNYRRFILFEDHIFDTNNAVVGSMSACDRRNEDIELFFEIVGYSLWSHRMQVDDTRVDRQLDSAFA